MNQWTKIHRETAFAYITNQGRLLVFRQSDSPDAGIQVPGGLIEPYETPSQAVLRNARLETGLEGLILHEYLGYAVIDLTRYGLNETHRRHFFHVVAPGEAPVQWLYPEPHPEHGVSAPKVLEFYWVNLPNQVPELTTELDALVGGINLGLKS
jgi:ADP-ribose pyrophosphatase YjhB (NUDIX family)